MSEQLTIEDLLRIKKTLNFARSYIVGANLKPTGLIPEWNRLMSDFNDALKLIDSVTEDEFQVIYLHHVQCGQDTSTSLVFYNYCPPGKIDVIKMLRNKRTGEIVEYNEKLITKD